MASTPVWRSIAAAIETAIRDGPYAAGDRLPSEHELARTHQVSRPTIVHAMHHLTRSGLVQRRQGIGTFVTAAAATHSDGFVLHGTADTTLRIENVEPARLHAVAATATGNIVAAITVEAMGDTALAARLRRPAEDYRDWTVLTGTSGWAGYQRTTRVTATLVAGTTRLNVATSLQDTFSPRHYEIVLTLDPAVFSVQLHHG